MIKVKVRIPENFKVGWYPHKITGQPRFETALSNVTRKQHISVTQTKGKGHTYTNPRPGQYLKDAHHHNSGQWQP